MTNKQLSIKTNLTFNRLHGIEEYKFTDGTRRWHRFYELQRDGLGEKYRFNPRTNEETESQLCGLMNDKARNLLYTRDETTPWIQCVTDGSVMSRIK